MLAEFNLSLLLLLPFWTLFVIMVHLNTTDEPPEGRCKKLEFICY
jgi:hypothetical protein